MPMAEEPEVMNVRQASRYLGMSPDTLYKYVSENSVPAFKLGKPVEVQENRIGRLDGASDVHTKTEREEAVIFKCRTLALLAVRTKANA